MDPILVGALAKACVADVAPIIAIDMLDKCCCAIMKVDSTPIRELPSLRQHLFSMGDIDAVRESGSGVMLRGELPRRVICDEPIFCGFDEMYFLHSTKGWLMDLESTLMDLRDDRWLTSASTVTDYLQSKSAFAYLVDGIVGDYEGLHYVIDTTVLSKDATTKLVIALDPCTSPGQYDDRKCRKRGEAGGGNRNKTRTGQTGRRVK